MTAFYKEPSGESKALAISKLTQITYTLNFQSDLIQTTRNIIQWLNDSLVQFKILHKKHIDKISQMTLIESAIKMQPILDTIERINNDIVFYHNKLVIEVIKFDELNDLCESLACFVNEDIEV